MADQQFDVFLCHNSEDKPAVIEIAQQLQQNNLKPWLDVWELQPGAIWQFSLEQQIESIGAAAVFVGQQGFGPWQSEEVYAFLQEFIRRGCPVIPVMLSDAPQQPQLPIFLRNRHWVDFRQSQPDPLIQLIWGITGQKPEGRLNTAEVIPLQNVAQQQPVNQISPSPSPSPSSVKTSHQAPPPRSTRATEKYPRSTPQPPVSSLGSRRSPPIDIPWFWLTVIFALYGVQGYFTIEAWTRALTWALALALALAGTGAWAWVWAWAGTGARAWVWARALAGGLAGTGALVLAGSGAWALALLLAGSEALAGSEVWEKLYVHLQPRQVFWILWRTATAGLVSGALLAWFVW